MSIATIKSITLRIRKRYGSNEAAARAAGVSPGVWSGYENADRPETTIPLGRLLDMSLTAAERSSIVSLFREPGDEAEVDILDESGEAVEAVAALHNVVRITGKDGDRCETDKRAIRAAALEAKAQVNDVLKAVSK